ncbi:MAG: hypothetical protein ACLPXB_02485 [Thiobacillaceae bacterium]
MKILICFLALMTPAVAFSWNQATHAYIADRLGARVGYDNLNEMWGSVAPDLFNFVFDPALCPGWISDQTQGADPATVMNIWMAASTDKEKALAFGFLSHNHIIIKAALKELKIVEVPTTLSRDLRDRPPHLRPWRDGWRHLRYLLMLSPWAFAAPGALAVTLSLAIWIFAGMAIFLRLGDASPIGNYWIILAGSMLGLGHTAVLLAVAIHLYGRRQGYRRPFSWEAMIANWISLETMLLAGGCTFMAGLAILVFVLGYWSEHHYMAIGNMLPAVVGTTLMVIGGQNALGGFLLAVINGHEAEFLNEGKFQLVATPNRQTDGQEKSSRSAAG